MRKSIKLFMALAVIAMVAVSCQKEGQFNPSKKVKKITAIYTGETPNGKSFKGTLIKEFVWSTNRLNSVNCYLDGEIVLIDKYVYDSKNRVGELNQYDSDNNLISKYKYEYDGNKLIAIKEIIGSERGTWKIEHSGNVITQVSYKASENKGCNSIAPTADALFFLPDNVINDINIALKENSTKGFPETTASLSWKNNNLVGVSYTVGNATYNVTFTYDDKKNPLYGWYDIDLNDVEYEVMLSKNNVTMKSVETKEGNETKTKESTFNYTYTGSYPATCEYPTVILRTVDGVSFLLDATCNATFEY